jgi:hypothetical protein
VTDARPKMCLGISTVYMSRFALSMFPAMIASPQAHSNRPANQQAKINLSLLHCFSQAFVIVLNSLTTHTSFKKPFVSILCNNRDRKHS